MPLTNSLIRDTIQVVEWSELVFIQDVNIALDWIICITVWPNSPVTIHNTPL